MRGLFSLFASAVAIAVFCLTVPQWLDQWLKLDKGTSFDIILLFGLICALLMNKSALHGRIKQHRVKKADTMTAKPKK